MGRSICKKRVICEFLNCSHEGRSTLRSTDVLVYEWVEGKHTCMDLCEVSPLVGPRTGDFIVRHASLKIVSSKVVKHVKTYFDNQHIFTPFIFDTINFFNTKNN